MKTTKPTINFGVLELSARKCVHLKFLADTHANLRVELLKKKLSMQEVFEEIAQRIVLGDSVMMDILDDCVEKKRNTKLQKFSKTDADTLFDAIEYESPIEKKK